MAFELGYLAGFDIRYHCHVLVMTVMADGDITDMQETKDAIIKGSKSAPLSIIIVGVGDEDFEMMSELDADSGALVDTNGETCARDLVQFVPFKAAAGDSVRLSASVLREVPKQLLNYMCANERTPSSFAEFGVPMRAPEGDWYTKHYK